MITTTTGAVSAPTKLDRGTVYAVDDQARRQFLAAPELPPISLVAGPPREESDDTSSSSSSYQEFLATNYDPDADRHTFKDVPTAILEEMRRASLNEEGSVSRHYNCLKAELHRRAKRRVGETGIRLVAHEPSSADEDFDDDDDDDDDDYGSYTLASSSSPLQPQDEGIRSSDEDNVPSSFASMGTGARQPLQSAQMRAPSGVISADMFSAGGGGGGEQQRNDDVEDIAKQSCPLCYEELPFIEDPNVASVMTERMNSLRGVIFRFERMLTGRVSDDVVFNSMLQLRRLLIERHLESYSSTRFVRWTLPMLRVHYDARKGHRFDYVRSLDAEIEELDRVRSWIMNHSMFVDHPEMGERVFNLRAVDHRLRTSKAWTDALKAKVAALRLQASDAAVDTTAVLDALSTAMAMASTSSTSTTTRKRQRDADGAVGHLYKVGGW